MVSLVVSVTAAAALSPAALPRAACAAGRPGLLPTQRCRPPAATPRGLFAKGKVAACYAETVLSSTLHRRLIALLALCSLLGGAVLPAWAHALTVKRGALLSIEVCTAEGLRVIAPDVSAPGDAPVSGTAADHLKHCPFCAHTMGAPGMPPSPLAWTATPCSTRQ